MSPIAEPPLIAHVVYRFAVGGLENGIVNLINHMPAERYRHAVISLTDDAEIKARITQPDVPLFSLHKPPGQTAKVFPAFYRLLRQLRPAIVHTNNLAALETVLPAALAGARVRVHSEHGWDVDDLAGGNAKYRLIRRFYSPFVTRYIAVSDHLARYLANQVGVRPSRLTHIYNAVDTVRFRPASGAKNDALLPEEFRGSTWVIGTVGRLQAVKDQAALIRAFADVVTRAESVGSRCRLVIVGDGPMRAELEAVAQQSGVGDHVWFAGERADVPEILRAMDCFVLPSLAEGISYTLLEAMATGLPIVATNVGGNAEIVEDGISGTLVPSANASALADAMFRYFEQPDVAHRHGRSARARVQAGFSLEAMVGRYVGFYDELLGPPAECARCATAQ